MLGAPFGAAGSLAAATGGPIEPLEAAGHIPPDGSAAGGSSLQEGGRPVNLEWSHSFTRDAPPTSN